MNTNFETKLAVTFLFSLAAIAFILGLSGCGNGPQGPQGAQGAEGLPGLNCSVQTLGITVATPNGGSLITCPDGTQSLVLNGTPGQNGQPGTPGTVVAPVLFCKEVTTYPSTFSEVGFCINNTLWAVYSLNNGFLTEIPPGMHSSNGVNSSCTFTVGPNCQVSN